MIARRILFLIPCVLLFAGQARAVDQAAQYREGKDFANSQSQGTSDIAKDQNQKYKVPQYSDKAKNEAANNPYYSNPGQMDNDSAKAQQDNEAGRTVVESYDTRPQYNIDPDTDPIIVNSENAAQNAAQDYTECKQVQVCTSEGKEQKTCTETVSSKTFTCNSHIVGTPTPVTCSGSFPMQRYAFNRFVDGVRLYQEAKITGCNPDRTFDLWTDMHHNCPGPGYTRLPATNDGNWNPLPDGLVDWWCGGCNCSWRDWWKGGCTNRCENSTDINCTESCTYYIAFSPNAWWAENLELFPCRSDSRNLCHSKCVKTDKLTGQCLEYAEEIVGFGSSLSGADPTWNWHWTSFSFSWRPPRCLLAQQSEDNQCGPYLKDNCQLIGSRCLDSGCKDFESPCQQICLDCWKYEKTYACVGAPIGGNCQALRDQGCYQTEGGTCIEKDANGVCKKMQYVYTCTKCLKYSSAIQCGNEFYCMDGNPECQAATREKSQDFPLFATHLAWVNQVGDDFDTNGNFIFVGDSTSCREDFSQGIRDCCDDRGPLAGCCNETERGLQEKRKNRLCVYVGRYCSHHLSLPGLRTCIEYRNSYCCFKSKLSRIIHEQGRKQLGRGWGSAENPDCGGFTPQELQRIDFSKIDFSEYYNDIKITLPSQQETADSAMEKFQDYYSRSGK